MTELTAAQANRVSNIRTVFDGLCLEYAKALQQKRLKEWCDAARAVIDYFETEPFNEETKL